MTTPNEPNETESRSLEELTGAIQEAKNPRQSVAEFLRSLAPITPRAWVTPTLVALNVAVFFAFCISGPKNIMTPTTMALIKWGANFGPKTTGGQPWRLFTAMFMHIGVIHILMNMAVLWDVGRIVERMTGNVAFLAAYVVAGLGGSLASVAWNPQITSAGASGAVFGIYGVLLGFLARSRGSVPPDVLKHLQKSAVVFIGYNVFYGLAKSGIDNAAHVGGLATGFLCGLLLAHPLTVEGARGRARKALVLLAGGLALTGGISFALPHATDFFGELEHLDGVEGTVIAAYNKMITNGNITDEEATRTLEHDVIPPWRAEHERWLRVKKLPPEQQAVADKIERYLGERQGGFEDMLAALAKHDSAAYQKGMDRVHQAGEMMKKQN